jgi:hypothetical protein
MTNIYAARRHLSVLSRLRADLEVRASRSASSGERLEAEARRVEIKALTWALSIASRLVERVDEAAADAKAIEAAGGGDDGLLEYYRQRTGL